MKKTFETHANVQPHDTARAARSAYVPPAVIDMPGISEATASGIILLPIEIQGTQGPS